MRCEGDVHEKDEACELRELSMKRFEVSVHSNPLCWARTVLEQNGRQRAPSAPYCTCQRLVVVGRGERDAHDKDFREDPARVCKHVHCSQTSVQRSSCE